MLDLSQYTFSDTVKEEVRPYSYIKAKILLAISFVMFFVMVGELVFFLVAKFPQSNAIFWAILNGVLSVGNMVLFFLSGATTKKALRQGADARYTKASISIVLFNTILFLSITAFFIVRIFNPEFLSVL